jgi:hypothetical protein
LKSKLPVFRALSGRVGFWIFCPLIAGRDIDVSLGFDIDLAVAEDAVEQVVADIDSLGRMARFRASRASARFRK